MSKLIQMSSGAPDIADGNYIVTLTGIEGPKVIVPQSGPQAGEEVRIFDWTFATEDGQEFSDTTSARTGPRSKMRAWISALLGRAPAKDEGFDPEDLVGRQAVAVIRTNDAGWPRIETLGVLMQQPQPVAATQPTPQPPVAPAAQPVAAAPAQAAPPPAAAPAPELPLG